MAWTVAYALLGALILSMIVAPVLASFLFGKGANEWQAASDLAMSIFLLPTFYVWIARVGRVLPPEPKPEFG